MAKIIRVWDGTQWQEVGTALPNAVSTDGVQTLTNKTISGSNNTLTNIPNNALTNSAITINGSAVSLGGSVTIAGGSAQDSEPTSPTEGQLWLDTNSTSAASQFIENANLTTTGDIIYASAANTPARLGIGSSNQLLSVSSGIPAWVTYIPQLNEQKFTSSGTFTVPAGTTKVWATVVGGGGQGGSSGFTLGINFGGTAGAYLTEQVTVTPGATVSVTVGAGNGNASSFGSLSASGGYSPGGFYDATGNGVKYAGVGESAYGVGGTGNTGGVGGAAPSNSGAGGGAASSGFSGGNGGSGIVIVRWIS
jgi:hypothetical protein